LPACFDDEPPCGSGVGGENREEELPPDMAKICAARQTAAAVQPVGTDWDCLPYVHDDGGRAAAGFRGVTGDCTCRSIAIATQQDYRAVYDALNAVCKNKRPRKRQRRQSSARTGIPRPTIRAFLDSLGWRWVPTIQIGQGCTVHLRVGELPPGRLIVSVSRHITAVIDGVIHDNHDPSRDGTRCVYGYWIKS
jgi:hypothetical protein